MTGHPSYLPEVLTPEHWGANDALGKKPGMTYMLRVEGELTPVGLIGQIRNLIGQEKIRKVLFDLLLTHHDNGATTGLIISEGRPIATKAFIERGRDKGRDKLVSIFCYRPGTLEHQQFGETKFEPFAGNVSNHFGWTHRGTHWNQQIAPQGLNPSPTPYQRGSGFVTPGSVLDLHINPHNRFRDVEADTVKYLEVTEGVHLVLRNTRVTDETTGGPIYRPNHLDAGLSGVKVTPYCFATPEVLRGEHR